MSVLNIFRRRAVSEEPTIAFSKYEAADAAFAIKYLAENELFPAAGLRWEAGLTLARAMKFVFPDSAGDYAAAVVATTDQIMAARDAAEESESHS